MGVNNVDELCINTIRPTLIKTHSHICYGSPNKQDSPEVYGALTYYPQIEALEIVKEW